MKAAFLDFDSLGPGDIDTTALRALLPAIALYPSSATADVSPRLEGLDAVLVNKVRLGRETLERAAHAPEGGTRLRYIGLAATGTDNVDVTAARELGIAVTHIRHYAMASVVQHAFGLILHLTLRLGEYLPLVAAGAWQRRDQFCMLDFPIRELSGKTLGIVGYGELGSAVAAAGRAFGMRVIASRTTAVRERSAAGPAFDVDRLALPDLLGVADVLSLHCPLTPETRHMIDASALRSMRPDALLINTARGGLVDGRALFDALREGRLGGAGIDVLPEEPPVHGDPLLGARLPNLVVTPHIAWAARESRQRALDEVVANLREFLAGGRRNRVD